MNAPTRILPDGRVATIVPADEAGEYMLTAAEGLLAHLEQGGRLNWRQATAAAELARLYGIGGGKSPWRRTGGAERDEKDVEAARRQFEELLSYAPPCCHWPLTLLAMGEWMAQRDPLPIWRRGLDAIADRLGYAKDA